MSLAIKASKISVAMKISGIGEVCFESKCVSGNMKEIFRLKKPTNVEISSFSNNAGLKFRAAWKVQKSTWGLCLL